MKLIELTGCEIRGDGVVINPHPVHVNPEYVAIVKPDRLISGVSMVTMVNGFSFPVRESTCQLIEKLQCVSEECESPV